MRPEVKGDVHNCKDDVGLVTDIVKSDRSDHDNKEVEDPIGRSCQSICRSTDLQWDDFRRVQPCHTEPTDSEKGVENKQEDATGDVGLVITNAASDGEDHHGQGHACGAEEHKGATAESFDGEDGHPRGDEVFRPVAGGDQTGIDDTHAHLLFEQFGDVVGDQVDA